MAVKNLKKKLSINAKNEDVFALLKRVTSNFCKFWTNFHNSLKQPNTV